MPQAVVIELVGGKSPLYPSRYAHGLFFSLLQTLDPQLASRLHEARRKPFTLAPLNSGNGTVSLRFTSLDDDLFGRFLHALFQWAPEGFALGDTPFRLARVIGSPELHPLAGRATWEDLAAAAPKDRVALWFVTPTVFITSKAEGRTRYTPLPDPRLIVNSLLEKWQAHSPFPYNPKEEAALRALFELDLELEGFRKLLFHRVWAGKAPFPGFTGEVRLRLWAEALEVRQALGRLAALAPYGGVGAKTAYGMGVAVTLEGQKAP